MTAEKLDIDQVLIGIATITASALAEDDGGDGYSFLVLIASAAPTDAETSGEIFVKAKMGAVSNLEAPDLFNLITEYGVRVMERIGRDGAEATRQ